MKKTAIRLGFATVTATLALAASAAGAPATPPPIPANGQQWTPTEEHVVYVMDQSGSMNYDGKDNKQVVRPRYAIARENATQRLLADQVSADRGRNYELLTFSGTGAKPVVVVPFSDNFNADGSLKSLEERTNMIIEKIRTLPPPADWTNLADAKCEAIRSLYEWGVTPDTRKPGMARTLMPHEVKRLLFVYTDGEENSSPGACSPSLDANGQEILSALYETTVSEKLDTHEFLLSGTFPTQGSWQWKVLGMALARNPNMTAVPASVKRWMVPVFNIQNLDSSLGNQSSLNREGGIYGAHAVNESRTDPAADRLMFKTLAAISGGRYEETASTDPAYRQRIPGDVDDNPCVDDADLSVVFMYWDQAVDASESGREHRRRADFNLDGWVNLDDYTILLQHYGEGCI